MDVLWKHRKQQVGEQFIEATKQKDEQQMLTLLDTGSSITPDLVNYADIDGYSALHHACMSGSLGLCEFLLKNGADATARDKEGSIPLHLLHASPELSTKGTQKYFQVLMLMLEQEPKLANTQNDEGNTTLHSAVIGGNEEIVSYLLKFSQIDVNKTNKKGETALNLACSLGNLPIVESLLEMGADSTIASEEGTCVNIALKNGHNDIAELISEKLAAANGVKNGLARSGSGILTPRTKERKAVSISTKLSPDQTVLAQHFNIGTNEKLIKVYACAYERSTQRGKLYITEAHLCFHSVSFFGSDVFVKIDLNDVISLDKTNSAFVLPNAISVKTQNQQYNFISFLDRTEMFTIIEAVWDKRQTELARWKRSRARAISMKDLNEAYDLHIAPPTDHRPRDSFGFVLDKDVIEIYKECCARNAKENPRFNELLEKKWLDILPTLDKLNLPDADPAQKERIMLFVRKAGIPFEARGKAWYILSGAEEKKKSSKTSYEFLVSQNSEQIDKDIPRTFPDHLFFESEEGKNSLRRVLIAYSARNPSVGYCQSMNYIAGCLLLFVDEEDAFWILAKIVEELLVDYFSRSMIGWCVDNRVFRHLMVRTMPKVFDHLEAIEFPFSSITSGWFMCLFLNNLPPETVFRIWDCLFFEGLPILFIFSLAIFKCFQNELLATTEPYEVIDLLKNYTKTLFDCEKLFKKAFTEIEYLDQNNIAKLRLKYWYKVSNELDEMKDKKKNVKTKRLDNEHTLKESHLFEIYQLFEEAKKNKSSMVDGLDEAAFADVLCQLLPEWKNKDTCIAKLFAALDEEKYNVIGLNELIRCVTVLKKGRLEDKFKLWFRMFDQNNDNYLTLEEFYELLKVLNNFYFENNAKQELELLEKIKQHSKATLKRKEAEQSKELLEQLRKIDQSSGELDLKLIATSKSLPDMSNSDTLVCESSDQMPRGSMHNPTKVAPHHDHIPQNADIHNIMLLADQSSDFLVNSDSDSAGGSSSNSSFHLTQNGSLHSSGTFNIQTQGNSVDFSLLEKVSFAEAKRELYKNHSLLAQKLARGGKAATPTPFQYLPGLL